jgi:two-component system, NtrC family, sensor kinase
MNIAAKLNAGILAVFAASAIANYSVLRATIQPKFDEIEVASAETNHKRVIDAIDTLQVKLRSSTQDWGYWDESYDFARGATGQTFIEANLKSPAETLGGLGIDVFAIFDAKGNFLWGNAIDGKSKEPIPGLADELKSAGFSHPYLSGIGEFKSLSGLIKTSKGLLLIATAPIIKTDHSGAAAGTIWMGSLLDEQALQDLTRVKFHLEPAAVRSPALAKVIMSNTSKDLITTSSQITDIAGKPLADLRAETPRDVSAAGAAAIGSAMWLSITLGAIVLLSLWLFVKKIVVSRVSALTQHFASAGSTGQIRRTELTQSSDELGQLASSFNGLAHRVNQLRDVLVCDSAYIGGVSEWATGTLHNVRNGLTPINCAAWKAQNMFEDPAMANVKLALEQLASPGTAADRREKLTAYVLAKAPQILDYGNQVKALSEEILSASKTVQDMASGYEKFVRREVGYETIDLLPLIQDVAKSAVTSQRNDVRLLLPAQTAATIGNRTLLWQILSNILTNAVEAMDRLPREKQIRVELQHINGNLKLSISDSGEGIPPEHLKTIFERGFSTRQNKIGGLGLHWCASAAKELGGSLTAESSGPGSGATFILSLPSPQTHGAASKNNDIAEAA